MVMKKIFNRLVIIALMSVIVIFGATSCKGKKGTTRSKAAAEAQYKNKVNEAKNTLKTLMSDDCTWSLKEKEDKLNTIKSDALKDEELSQLIKEAEKYINRERIAAGLDVDKPHVVIAPKADDSNVSIKVVDKNENILNTLFDNIASGKDVSSSVTELNALFESKQTPVLIIISKSEKATDYDRPTTIDKYIDYLVDQKVSRNKVYSIQYNDDKKIKVLELIRK
jgi:hypothetical protein